MDVTQGELVKTSSYLHLAATLLRGLVWDRACAGVFRPSACYCSAWQAELLQRKSIVVRHVLVTSDERDASWWKKFADMGTGLATGVLQVLALWFRLITFDLLTGLLV